MNPVLLGVPGGSIISHNVVAPLRPGLSEAGRVRAARVCVVLLGLVAFAIALRSTTIHEIVETASSIGSSGLIVVALFGLFTRFGGGPAAALAALATGAVVWLAGIFFSFTSVPYVLAVGLATLAYVVVGLFFQPARPARDPPKKAIPTRLWRGHNTIGQIHDVCSATISGACFLRKLSIGADGTGGNSMRSPSKHCV